MDETNRCAREANLVDDVDDRDRTSGSSNTAASQR
jgi:hypothetical protein